MAEPGRHDLDQAEAVVAGSERPALRIGYSRVFSLYQVVVALASGREAEDLGLPADVRWRAAAARVEALRSPLGPFAYFEPGVIGAGGVAEFGEALAGRARTFAT